VTRTESVIRRPKEQRQRGETAAAGASYTEADAAQSPLDLANAHRVRALAFACLGRNKDAARDWQAARCLYDELGVAAGVAECDRRLNGI
jgi:hypothetical protein